MPFTPAHIAAVLPGKRSGFFSFTALIIGSMVPDYEYFLRMTLYGHYGHTLAGIVLFDLPVGILLYAAYHAAVRKELIRHLPPFLYRRFSCAENFDWKKYAAAHGLQVVLSVLAGTLTHLVWDGFTHDEEYYFARFLPFLLHRFRWADLQVPLYSVLQALSSVAGMVLVAGWVIRLPESRAKREKSGLSASLFWCWVLLVALVAGLVRWAAGMPDEKPFGQFVVVSISALHIGVLVVCVACRAGWSLYKAKAR